MAIIAISAISFAAYKATMLQVAIRPKVAAVPARVPLQTMISSIQFALPASYTYLHQEAPDSQTTIGYQLPGEDFQVILPLTSPSIAFLDTNSTDEEMVYSDLGKAATSLSAYLERDGFTSIPAQDQSSGLLDSVYFYQRSDSVCQVIVDTQLSLVCSPLVELEEAAAQAKPLVSLYNGANPNSGMALITAPTIYASKTAGYTVAHLPIYNNHGETDVNFYKQGQEVWRMVDLSWYNDPHEDADIIPNCEDFNSAAQIRAAFAGQSCYDSDTATMGLIQ